MKQAIAESNISKEFRFSPWVHLFFWLFYCGYIFDYMVGEFAFSDALLFTFFEGILSVGVFYLNWLVLLPCLLSKNKWLYGIGLLAATTVLFAIYQLTGLRKILLDTEVWRACLSLFLNQGVILLLSFLAWYYARYRKLLEENLIKEHEKKMAELDWLRQQLSPHFLFNMLNNLYQMVSENNAKTGEMILKLSELLRYLNYEACQKTVAIDQEVAIINNFIVLNELRQMAGKVSFQNNLTIKNAIQIPPMVFFSVVENAFKHSDIITNPHGFIKITIDFDVHPYIMVTNSYISSSSKVKTNGLGIHNLKRQLEILSEQKNRFEVKAENNCYTAKLYLFGIEEV